MNESLSTPALIAWEKLRDDLIFLKREGRVAGGFTEVGWQAVLQRMETIREALNAKATT